MPQQIVINDDFGRFILSHTAIIRIAELKGWNLIVEETNIPVPSYRYYINEKGSRLIDSDFDRDDPDLVKVVDELGGKASGSCANLKIITVPDDVDWTIKECDGKEWVADKHRIWE